jgi:ribonuclease BN (tRNA processing enzyme)
VTRDKWYTLGTIGGPIQHPDAFQISNLLEVGESLYLLDVGNGVLRQMAKVGKQVANVKVVFLSHHHPDHIADLGLVILSRWLTKPSQALRVIGPKGTAQLVSGLAAAFIPVTWTDDNAASTEGSIAVSVIGEDVGSSTALIPAFSDENLQVWAANVDHFNAPTDAYRPSAQAIGFRIQTEDRVIAYTGDTGASDGIAAIAVGADLLVTEVCDLDGITERFDGNPNLPAAVKQRLLFNMEHNHIDPRRIGEFAATAGVRQVLLTHFVPAPPADPEVIQSVYADPIQEAAPGVTVSIATDLAAW